MLSKLFKFGASAVAFSPFLALAQGGIVDSDPGGTLVVGNVLTNITTVLGYVVLLIIALAVVYFIWNLLKYIQKSGEEQTEARNAMIWGIIIIAVMVSIWGLVTFLQNAVGVGSNVDPQYPTIPGGTNNVVR